MDYHGHVLINTNVQPPGFLPLEIGAKFNDKKDISGVTYKEIEKAPNFKDVYPVFYRIFDPSKRIVGAGLDPDLAAFGLSIPANRICDIGASKALAEMGYMLCLKHKVDPPKSLLCFGNPSLIIPACFGLKDLSWHLQVEK